VVRSRRPAVERIPGGEYRRDHGPESQHASTQEGSSRVARGGPFAPQHEEQGGHDDCRRSKDDKVRTGVDIIDAACFMAVQIG
jgi:hypothetical protein